MGVALAGVSLPIYFTGLVLAVALQLQVAAPVQRALRRHHRTTRSRGHEPAAALDLPRLPVRRAVRPAHPRQHARDDGRGLHPHRAGEGPQRAAGHRQARAARRADARSSRSSVSTSASCSAARSSPSTTFGFAGIGKLAVDAIIRQDLPVILGVTLFAAFFIVMANLIVDVLYAFVDPRVRLLVTRPPAAKSTADGRSSVHRRAVGVPRRTRPAHPLPDRRRPGQARSTDCRSRVDRGQTLASWASPAPARA